MRPSPSKSAACTAIGSSTPRSMEVVALNVTRETWPDGPDTAVNRSAATAHAPPARRTGRLHVVDDCAARFERRDFTSDDTPARTAATATNLPVVADRSA